ncbi:MULTISPECIES: tripartite tricarboxylate transporter substrate-binding protein [unclassified Variovorax]|uniref:Bug family tripartite tricarboxylate transporter substrate binding protein n=1 Tax=unclassified Variovorax TaxID=663243 RepID=UPI000F7EB2D4|nr:MULTISPECIES: tripartite tricarboxylate transporter substrate-binding protein [unclassified Variovorax]RSZ32334.1 tripartite tricarboxylate transporter substrate binding protein [Variovorax sp. 553]RSZ32622.1 tripartite tricarboxylate transporter substrate binding protein [Variovorax sp. 679]
MAALAAAGAPRAAKAQYAYPARTIRWIVPYPAGAGADIVARTIAAQFSIDTGQSVILENRAGGNTALGAIEAARAPADGYTVLSADNGTLVFNPALYRNLSYNPSRDFAPVTLLGRLPMVLLVGPASGVKDARAFIDDARAFPGKVSFASAGTGSPQHLAMELLEREARLEMVHVPYRSAAAAVADVAGGQLPVMMCDMAASRRFIQSGRLRALAVAHPARLAQLPRVPTFAELGFPRVEAAALMGLVVPVNTPGEIVSRLQQLVASAIHNPVVLRRLAEYGVDPAGDAPSQFAALLRGESARWHPLIRELNLSLD